jgi:hypothetical protein
MSKKSTPDAATIVISVASTLIALAATVSTCILAWDTHRQNAIANDASLGFDIDTDESNKKLGVTLRNVGPGKMFVNSVRYYVDGQPVPTIEAAIAGAKLVAGRLRPIDLTDEWMGPGETVKIFQYLSRDDTDRAADFIEEHLAVSVRYCTIEQRCETKCSEKGKCGVLPLEKRP